MNHFEFSSRQNRQKWINISSSSIIYLNLHVLDSRDIITCFSDHWSGNTSTFCYIYLMKRCMDLMVSSKIFFVTEVVRKDFITAVQSHFLFGFFPTGINSTVMSLVSKKITSKTMRDYRLIACCCLLYKVISKIIANRLEKSFLLRLWLLENVLLATELVNGYHTPNISDQCTIKFDISKASDTVNGVSSHCFFFEKWLYMI